MTKENVIELIKEMISAHSCYAGLKEKANNYINSLGTNNEKENVKLFIEELEADVLKIDDVIGFFNSDEAKNHFDEGTRKNFLAHMIDVKNSGGEHCDCPACSKGLEILKNKDLIL